MQVLRLYALCLFSLSNVLIPSVPSPVALPACAARELFELLAALFLLLPEDLEDFVVAEEAGAVVECLAAKVGSARVRGDGGRRRGSPPCCSAVAVSPYGYLATRVCGVYSTRRNDEAVQQLEG